MTTTSTLLRTLLIYSICIPVAIFLGYMIGGSQNAAVDIQTYAGVGAVLFILVLPLLLRWHRIILVVAWNSCALLYFLPGRPEVALAITWLSFLISVLHYVVHPKTRFITVRSVIVPLVVLAAIVIFTAKVNGGIGFGALGDSTMGGKKYLAMITAIVGYFALTSQPIPPQKAMLYVLLFCAG